MKCKLKQLSAVTIKVKVEINKLINTYKFKNCYL